MAFEYTLDQVLALSPDAGSTKNARKLAAPRLWPSLGRGGDAVWGECKGSLIYEVRIDLSGPAFKCSCPSRKFPCKHALGLFLILAGEPAAIPQAEPPEWVASWLEARSGQAEKKAEKAQAKKDAQPADPQAEAKRAAAREKSAATREKNVAAGVEELSLWLRDLVRGGFASAQGNEWNLWDDVAKRMVDAQAKGLSGRVRGLAEAANSGEGWHGRLLERAASLHLLLEAFKRRERLPDLLRDEALDLVGFAQKKDDILAAEGVRDRWLALGMAIEPMPDANGRAQRTWLVGERTGLAALLLHFAVFSQPLDASIAPGTAFEGEVAFYPGARPERALLKERSGDAEPIAGFPSRPLDSLGQAWAEALAADPWASRLPAALEGVSLLRLGDGWAFRDPDGRLVQASARFGKGWELLAATGGHPFRLFGEWDGQRLEPMSAWVDGKFASLAGAEEG
jgi:hypothetical protein